MLKISPMLSLIRKFSNTLRILSHISLLFDFYMKNMMCKVADSSKCFIFLPHPTTCDLCHLPYRTREARFLIHAQEKTYQTLEE